MKKLSFKNKLGIIALAAVFCLLIGVGQATAQIDTDALTIDIRPISAPHVLGGVWMGADGSSVYAADAANNSVGYNNSAGYGWSLPDGSLLAGASNNSSPKHKAAVVQANDAAGSYSITTPNGSTWIWSYNKKDDYPISIGYAIDTDRFYFWRWAKIDAKQWKETGIRNATVYSVSEKEKKPRIEGSFPFDPLSGELIAGSKGEVYKINYAGKFSLQNTRGETVSSFEHLGNGYDKPKLRVTNDGKRLIVDNGEELLVLRFSDGAGLYHELVKPGFSRSVDPDANYVAYVLHDKEKPSLSDYRVRVDTVPDEPNMEPKIIWLSSPGAREKAVADLKIRKAQLADAKQSESNREVYLKSKAGRAEKIAEMIDTVNELTDKLKTVTEKSPAGSHYEKSSGFCSLLQDGYIANRRLQVFVEMVLKEGSEGKYPLNDAEIKSLQTVISKANITITSVKSQAEPGCNVTLLEQNLATPN